MMSDIHELKINPLYFDAIEKRLKTFELRKDDRDYKVGDLIILKEYVLMKLLNIVLIMMKQL